MTNKHDRWFTAKHAEFFDDVRDLLSVTDASQFIAIVYDNDSRVWIASIGRVKGDGDTPTQAVEQAMIGRLCGLEILCVE